MQQRQNYHHCNHGLLELQTGNFNITVKNEKTIAFISERMHEILYFFLNERCAIQLSILVLFNVRYLHFRAQNRASPG